VSRRAAILREMGLGPIWRLRRPPAEQVPLPAGEPVAEPAGQPAITGRATGVAGMDWDALNNAIRECRACELCRTRKQAVPGVGDVNADWLFVGEGPGAEEDERGEPFVGQAGKLLDAMLAAIDLKRGENVYIANSVKCRPPNNRTPEAGETAACWPFLERQIELIQPKLIVALGRPAAQTLLQRELSISSARGRLFAYKGVPLVVTYHPAYLLRNLPDKAKAWEDLCFMRRTMKDL
jgi:uracil-DNA glycosylase